MIWGARKAHVTPPYRSPQHTPDPPVSLQNTVTSGPSSAETCLHTAHPSPGDPAALNECPPLEDRKRSKSQGGDRCSMWQSLSFGTAFIALLKPARKGPEVTPPLVFDSRLHQSQNVSSDTPVGCWGCFTDSCSFASHLITCIHWTLTCETVSFTIFFLFLFSDTTSQPQPSLPPPPSSPLPRPTPP